MNISIINAALQHIPNKKYTIKHSFHTFSPKATALHKDLKQIGSIINNVKNSLKHHQPITNTITNQIQTLTKNITLTYQILLQTSSSYHNGSLKPNNYGRLYIMPEV